MVAVLSSCAKPPSKLAYNNTNNNALLYIEDSRYQTCNLAIIGKAVTLSEGSKYYYQNVAVINIITNRTTNFVPNIVHVAHLFFEPEVPYSNSVIYLNALGSNYWRLVNDKYYGPE
jgi:hypothetical protein